MQIHVSTPIVTANENTFAPELTMQITFPLEEVMDMHAAELMRTEQEFALMIGQEVLSKIKNR